MLELLSLIVMGPPVLLLAAGLVSDRWAAGHVRAMRQGAVALLTLAFLCSAVASASLLSRGGVIDVALLSGTWPVPLNLGIYFDSLAAIMSLLISFVGLMIARYSVRHLAGEARQGRFFRWIMFTLGAVLLMVVSRNLVMLTAAWMLTSLGLHQLLTHYPERPWAIWAARKKFLISRLGDLLLIGALVLTFYCFGSFDYSTIFAKSQASGLSDSGSGWLVSLICTLYALGAMTKSAQVPFHSWLPDTMETPTPVSALMHAGVINAGGFLIIRLSPLITQSHLALHFLTLIGATTAILGGVVMLTQTSIKRSLAYSTIAQMGFMMLQCGLGAFSAALLHIVAHSLYKAHAFLSASSVLDSAARRKATPRPPLSGKGSLACLLIAVAFVLGLGSITLWFWRVDLATKPGGMVAGLILTMALTHLVWQALMSQSWRVATLGLAGAGLASWVYISTWSLLDYMLSSSVPRVNADLSPLNVTVIAVVAIGFVGLFVLQATAGRFSHWPLVRSLYVHAANGFYLDIPARRLTSRIWGGSAPTP